MNDNINMDELVDVLSQCSDEQKQVNSRANAKIITILSQQLQVLNKMHSILHFFYILTLLSIGIGVVACVISVIGLLGSFGGLS